LTDGALAADLRTELVARTNVLRERGLAPKLAIVFVGENESSLAYVRNLARTGERAGIGVVVSHLPANASVEEVRAELEELRDDPTAHGVMLQHRCRRSFYPRNRDAIPPHKDVDGAHPTNQGHLAFGSGTEYVPARRPP